MAAAGTSPALVVIELPTFYASLGNAPRSADIVNIAKQLRQLYSCFREGQQACPEWRKKPIVPAEKPRIGVRELSREAIAQKEFLGALNKLSPQNKANVIRSINVRKEFGDMYIRLLWDAFLRAPDYHNIYLDIIDHISEAIGTDVAIAAFNGLWTEYVASEAWIPYKTVVETNGIAEAKAEYDEFCDNVKARKRALASMNAWITLTKYGIVNTATLLYDLIFADCNTRIKSKEPSKTLEVLLELLLEFIRVNGKAHGPSVGAELPRVLESEWKPCASEFPPAIRFKIYDLYEFVCVNIPKK